MSACSPFHFFNLTSFCALSVLAEVNRVVLHRRDEDAFESGETTGSGEAVEIGNNTDIEEQRGGGTKKKLTREKKLIISVICASIAIFALIAYLSYKVDLFGEEGSEDSAMRAVGNRGGHRGM